MDDIIEDGIALGGDFVNTDLVFLNNIGGTAIHVSGSKDLISEGFIKINDARNGCYLENEFENSGQLYLLNIMDEFALYLKGDAANSGEIVIDGSSQVCILQ